MGLTVLPPDVNASALPFTGQGREIRVGLMQVEGLARKAAETLLRERESGGPYRSFADFLRRTVVDAADAALLIKAGCFDALEGKERRPRLQWELLRHRGERQKVGLLFDEEPAELPSPPPYDDRTVLRQEAETLGMLLSCHPLQLHRREIARLRPVPAARLGEWVGRYITMVGWWVTGKTVQDKNGRPMEFVSFEDTTAIFDATFFPGAYERFCRKLSRSRPYLLKGKVEEAFGVATLNVEWVGFVEEKAGQAAGSSHPPGMPGYADPG